MGRPGSNFLLWIVCCAVLIWLPISYPALGNKVSDINRLVMEDDIAALRQAVSNDPALLNVQGNLGCTPLFWAAAHSHLKTVRFLLEQGAAVDIRNNDGKTALNMMMSYPNNNRRDITQILLDYGADPNSADKEGNTSAFGWASTEVLDLLEDYGADLQITNHLGCTVFDQAALYDDSPKLAMLQRLDIRSLDIFTACRRNEISMIQALLNNNPGLVRSIGLHGYTPLHVAAEKGYPACVNLLIEYGAEVDAKDENGLTPLIMAVCKQNIKCQDIECVEILLDHGASISIKDNRGESPLMWSINDYTGQALRLLLAYGASVQDKNENGENPAS